MMSMTYNLSWRRCRNTHCCLRSLRRSSSREKLEDSTPSLIKRVISLMHGLLICKTVTPKTRKRMLFLTQWCAALSAPTSSCWKNNGRSGSSSSMPKTYVSIRAKKRRKKTKKKERKWHQRTLLKYGRVCLRRLQTRRKRKPPQSIMKTNLKMAKIKIIIKRRRLKCWQS